MCTWVDSFLRENFPPTAREVKLLVSDTSHEREHCPTLPTLMTQLSRGTGCAHRGCPLNVLFMDNCMSVLPQRLVKMPELLDSSIHSRQYVRNNSVTQETQEMQVGEADILAGGIWSVLRVNRFSSIYPSRLGARGTSSSCHDCLQQLAASNFADVIPRPSTSPLRFLSAPCGHKDISDFLS